LRTVVEKVTGEKLEKLEFEALRGLAGIKEAEYELKGKKVKIAVVSGLKNAGKLLESIKAGEAHYDAIEIMGCPGGCVNGGGQPIQPTSVRSFNDLRALRGAALHKGEIDTRPIRKAHESPLMKELYDNFLGEPGGHKAHELLHTTYQEKTKYPGLMSEKKTD
jgi:NADP-reducing hydrogenase subunit HndD